MLEIQLALAPLIRVDPFPYGIRAHHRGLWKKQRLLRWRTWIFDSSYLRWILFILSLWDIPAVFSSVAINGSQRKSGVVYGLHQHNSEHWCEDLFGVGAHWPCFKFSERVVIAIDWIPNLFLWFRLKLYDTILKNEANTTTGVDAHRISLEFSRIYSHDIRGTGTFALRWWILSMFKYICFKSPFPTASNNTNAS